MIVCLPLEPEWWPNFDSGWDYDTHPGDCCPAVEGDLWTVCCRECAGTGIFPVPWIVTVEQGRADLDDTSCVACKASGRASIGLAAPTRGHCTLSVCTVTPMTTIKNSRPLGRERDDAADDAFLDEMARACTDYPPDYDRDRYDAYDVARSAWDEDFYEHMREAAAQDAAHDRASRWVDAWDRLAPLGVVGPEDRDATLAELERLVSYLGHPS